MIAFACTCTCIYMYILIYHVYCLFTDSEARKLQANGNSSETGSTEQRESGWFQMYFILYIYMYI